MIHPTKNLICLVFVLASLSLSAQQASIKGKVTDETGKGLDFATVALKSGKDSTLVKAETTDESGVFTLRNIPNGAFFLEVSYVGFQTYLSAVLNVQEDKAVEAPPISMKAVSKELAGVLVTAQRPLIEIKADRTVFNVQGTINAAGENAINLLRKAPGVLVDNNDNISVLSRSGVLVYVDGKRLPLSGQELTSYLQNLTAEQIDKIDIITNPGARYEAQGNAGIIDIRLKKDKNLGYNGSVSLTASQGRYATGNINTTMNYRAKKVNIFGNVGTNLGKSWNEVIFKNYQNGLLLDENNQMFREFSGYNYRVGSDFYLGKNHTLGVLYTGAINNANLLSNGRNNISRDAPNSAIDSVLLAQNISAVDRTQNQFNVNYVYQQGKKTVNADFDYGIFNRLSDTEQPNLYYNGDLSLLRSKNEVFYTTPVDIAILASQVDFENEYSIGKISTGAKFTNVVTDNTFRLFDVANNGTRTQNDRRSNRFKYDESVFAGYVNFARQLNKMMNLTAGLRVEHTLATGDLKAFLPELQEPSVDFDYTSYFPSAGITYQKNPNHVYSLNYGRRINRPDYNVLNPFKEQISELSFSKGNAFLQPEIVNNIELGYTLKYRYSFKLAYSLTNDQITRLIGPDKSDPRAGFISYDNLATQKVYSFNVSAPVQITKWWNGYFNASASYIDNQADYGENGIVDVQAGTYSIFQQQTFTLPKGWKAEFSGYYSGPGVWGGVFLYEPQYSINLGIQRRFLKEKMNVRLNANDIFFSTGWRGVSEFNGLRGEGRGNWDSRRATLSITYDFGNKNVKSRKRQTSIEDATKRVGQ